MKSYRSVAVVLFVSIFSSMGCSRTAAPPASSSAGALLANSSAVNPIPRPFEKHTLSSGNYLNQFIRPEIRSKLDEEPTGDADASFDPSTSEATPSGDESQAESTDEPQDESAEQHPAAESDESFRDGARLDTLKFAWARPAFGDAIKASPTNTGVIVVYADENYFEIDRLMGYIEEGRDKVVAAANIGGERVQVVFGGYRGTPQVEMWVVPQGGQMPEFKPDERPKAE